VTIRMLRGDAPPVAQITRLRQPQAIGAVALTILSSGKFLTFPGWDPNAIAAAWNACTYPEFLEATASVDGSDVLLTSKLAGRPFYVSASLGGNPFGNETQTITPVNVTGGTAICTWQGQATASFSPLTTSAANLKTLFEALANGVVQANELTWSGPVGGPWTVTFGGRYTEQNVSLISINQTSLTGGIAAQDEKERLSLPPFCVDPVTFSLRRPDTLQTPTTLATPLLASAVQSALTAIGYTTTCTGGPLEAGGQTSETDAVYQFGRFNATAVTDNTANYTSPIGLVPTEASESTMLMLCHCGLANGQTIDVATLRIWFVPDGSADSPAIPGCTIKAVKVANASWPATAAAIANTLTTAAANFDIPYVPVNPGIGSAVFVDVTAVVQEIVNQGGWSAGHAILFYVIPPPTTNYATISSVAGGVYTLPRVVIETSTGGAPIVIEWTGGNAATDIPQLIVVPSGGYTSSPVIDTIQNGHPAAPPLLVVAVTVAGGEAIAIRDDARSRGPNHYDDPLNWESDDTTFSVPEDGNALFVESGKVDLLYGLKQRSQFIALPASNRLRVTDVHHLWVGLAVQVVTTVTLPTGLAAATRYYVVAIDGPYIQLSATRGGAPVTVSDAGTGIHTLGIRLISAEIQARWSGKLGLPRLNTNNATYFEYRERFLTIWCDAIKLGSGNGSGSNRQNFDTGIFQTKLQAITSGGSIETGVNAVLWKGTNAANELESITADLGVAIFPEETASFDKLIQRGGTCTLGRGVTGNTIDKTAGSITKLGCVIGGQVFEN
jgi:hypothetical protein